MALTPAQEIRGAQEAVARRPGRVAGSVEDQVVVSLQNKNADEALNMAAGRTLDFPAIRKLVDSNLGYKDAAGNQVQNAREAAMKARADAMVDIYDRYLNTADYNALAPADKTALVNAVSGALLSEPGMSSYFASMTPANAAIEARRMAGEYLRDPAFRGKVKELLTQKADITKPLPDQVSKVKAESDAANAEEARLRAEKATLDGNVAAKQAQMNQYIDYRNPAPPPPLLRGAQLTALETARANVATAEGQIQNIERNIIPNHERQLAKFQEELNIAMQVAANPALAAAMGPQRPIVQIRADITARDGLINTQRAILAGHINTRETNNAQITTITEAKTRVENELNKLEADKKKMDTDYAKAQKDQTDKNREFTRLQAEKQLQEENFVASIGEILGDAVADRVKGELSAARAKVKELDQKAAEGQVDKDRKPLQELMAERNFDAKGNPDRTQIQQDWNVLMAPVRTYVINDGAGNNVTLQLNGQDQALYRYLLATPGLTPADRFRLMQDKKFIEEMGPKVAEKIVVDKLLGGGGITKAEVIRIQRSSWGAGMVDRAITNRDAIKKAVDNAAGKGALDWKGNLAEQLKKLDWKKFMLILLIIAGLLGVTGALASK